MKWQSILFESDNTLSYWIRKTNTLKQTMEEQIAFFQRKTLVELKQCVVETQQKWKGISKWKKDDYVKALAEYTLSHSHSHSLDNPSHPQPPSQSPSPSLLLSQPPLRSSNSIALAAVENVKLTPLPLPEPERVVEATATETEPEPETAIVVKKRRSTTTRVRRIPVDPFLEWKSRMARANAEYRKRSAFPKWNYEMSEVLDELTKGNRTPVSDLVFNVIDGQCTLSN